MSLWRLKIFGAQRVRLTQSTARAGSATRSAYDRPTRKRTGASYENGTARGRIGYAFDRFLPYITGGGAFGDVKGSLLGAGDFKQTKAGWTAGAGVEYAFIDNWSAKIEYLYVDLGKTTCDATCSSGNPMTATFTSKVVRGGLNYKF